jgi:hypothetical protein
VIGHKNWIQDELCFQENKARSKPHTTYENYSKPPLQQSPLYSSYSLSKERRTHLLGVEDTSNTLANNSLILVGTSTASRNLGKNVIGSEHTSRPAGPAEVDVRVGHEVVEDVADGGEAGLVVGATGLGEDGLAAVGAEPAGELGEAGDVVRGGDAGGVGAWVVCWWGVWLAGFLGDDVVQTTVEEPAGGSWAVWSVPLRLRTWVRVLVDVEDKVGLASVEVGDLIQGSGRAVIDEHTSVGLFSVY